jgi:hypothetical protein
MIDTDWPAMYPLQETFDDSERNESTWIDSERENIVGFDPLVDGRTGQ